MGNRNQGRSTGSRMVVVQLFDNSLTAQQAVDFLADRDYPVERLSVVARDLVFVEQVTGQQKIRRGRRRREPGLPGSFDPQARGNLTEDRLTPLSSSVPSLALDPGWTVDGCGGTRLVTTPSRTLSPGRVTVRHG